MFFAATIAAAMLLAGTDQAQPAPAETAAAAQPAPAAAPAEAAKPKTRRVCYVDPSITGSRMQKKRCVEQPIEEPAKPAETK